MRATIKDIARETGLSIATISKYLNGITIKKQNKTIIDEAIVKLNYTVNEYARGLKINKTRTIGVIIPELSNIFITNIISKMEETLRQNGYSTIICDCQSDANIEIDAVKFLLSKRIDGIINMPTDLEGGHLKIAIENSVPTLLIDRMINNLENKVDSVVIDNSKAAADAVSYLTQNGHKDIGIILGPQNIYTSSEREKGYKHEINRQGIKLNEGLMFHGDYKISGGYEGLKTLLEKNPSMTAVFVTNYEMTLGAIIYANENGIKIPEQLSIIGFDNMELSRVFNPKLTIMSQPLQAIGDACASTMLKRLSESTNTVASEKIVLEASMIKGDSVAKI